MEYQEAKYIRNMPSLSDLIRREAVYGHQGAFGAVKESLKQKFNVKKRLQAKMVGIKEKFDPMNWARAMFGKTGAALYGRAFNRSDADMQYFAGRARPLGGRSYQIGEVPKYRGYEPIKEKSPLTEKIFGSSDKKLLPILNEMYGFLKKTAEDEKLQRELLNNKREELDSENERRHKELLKTIRNIGVKTTTAIPVKKENVGPNVGLFDSIFGTIRDMVQGMIDKALKYFEWINDLKKIVPFIKDILKFFGAGVQTLLRFMAGPLMGPLAVATSLASFLLLAKQEKEAIENNPYDVKYKNNPYAMTLRNEAQSVAQAGKQNIAKTLKQFRRNEIEDVVNSKLDDSVIMSEYGQNKKGLSEWLVKNPQKNAIYQAPSRGLGSTGGSSVGEMPDETLAETQRLIRQNQKNTVIKPENKNTTVPISETKHTTPSNVVNSLIVESNNLKLQSKFSAPKEQVINNNSVNNLKHQENTKVKIPPVRNHEESFSRMIYQSTRVV